MIDESRICEIINYHDSNQVMDPFSGDPADDGRSYEMVYPKKRRLPRKLKKRLKKNKIKPMTVTDFQKKYARQFYESTKQD